MLRVILILFGVFLLFYTKAQPVDFNSYPVYTGNDLGLTYSPARSFFRIWAPAADEVEIRLYKEGLGGEAIKMIQLDKSDGGTWCTTIKGDWKNSFYAFRTKIDGNWMQEVPDPYAKTVGINGRRAMVVDLKETEPAGWAMDRSPVSGDDSPLNAIIYELHVRDASINVNSGIKNKGKFIGLTETGTKNTAGLATGLDHLNELGVTHIHLLPSYDFYSVDETKPGTPQYNWGYDPLNYNTTEGSYATNASDGITRIKEFKQLIQTFHNNGLRVVMDVVYNHTMLTETSFFNQLVPGYYYRQKGVVDKKDILKPASFSNATACGNETASERPMMRKFMLESVLYWAKEFHIDGFRFDLMGVHDIVTMNLISAELHKINPAILLYGEGWTAGDCPLPDSLRAIKRNAWKLDRIAVFSDDIRDGIKGSVFDAADRGFASGKKGMEESIKFGIAASCRHPQVDYNKVNYSKAPYAAQPWNTITYCECHDNNVLWDKLGLSCPDNTDEQKKEMQMLALGIVLTSQGIPFLHAGTEFLRTKHGVENSFNSGDSINAIDWDMKTTNHDVFDFVSYLIQLRKQHPAFRMTTAEAIATNIRFAENTPGGIVAYTIDGAAAGDAWKKIYVAFNGGSGEEKAIPLTPGGWHTAINTTGMTDMQATTAGSLRLKEYSMVILYQ